MQTKNIHDILLEYWGYSAFRPMQEGVINAVLNGKDVLALLPTGGGKSLCFQVPAMAMPGICIVVSPLIALMHDQVKALREKNIKAEALVSGISFKDLDRILDNCIYGKVKFLYLSPERLRSDLVRTRIAKMKVNILAVDEAHCISQWGYDFRPAYLQLAEVRDLCKAPTIALTATATPKVVDDIQDKLHFAEKNVLQRSFFRPELIYNVVETENKVKKTFEILEAIKGSSIVYVRNRRRTRQVAELLNKQGISAAFYHAGLERNVRTEVQESWVTGRTRVIVATNAFGMGIDKPDVRSVIHLDLPDGPEAYFQEAGRAGRDGIRSFAVLVYNSADIRDLGARIEQNFPTKQEIKKVYTALCDQFSLAEGSGKDEVMDLDLSTFCKAKKIPARQASSALKILALNGYIEINDRPQMHSSVLFTASKEQVQEMVQTGKTEGRIADLLIRSYGGLFEEKVEIDEMLLAARMALSEMELKTGIRRMQDMQMLEYREHSGRPTVTFLCERIALGDLSISKESYSERKIRAQERLDAMTGFVQQDQECRSVHLLAYFGEKKAKTCGHCDVCRGKHKGNGPDEVERSIKKKEQLFKKGVSYHELLDTRPIGTVNETKAVRWVMDNDALLKPQYSNKSKKNGPN